MITLTKTITYSDERENIEFWAKYKNLIPQEATPTDEELIALVEDKIISTIKSELTAPIASVVAEEVQRQSLETTIQLINQKTADVLSHLTVQ